MCINCYKLTIRTFIVKNNRALPLSKVDTATYKLSDAIVRCLIGAGSRGRKVLRRGFAKVHFTNTHSPPPVYIWPPVKLINVCN